MAYLNGPYNYAVTAEQVKDKTWNGRAMLKTPRFCNAACRSGLRVDRQEGLIYSAELVEFDDGDRALLSVELASRFTRHCAYCGAYTLKD